jgi:hypothetical protein
MKRIYNTGLDSNEIEFDISVGTVGLANTIVTQRWTGGTFKVIRESDADSGNVPEFVAGTARNLRGSYVVSVTVIDFSNLPQDHWEQALKTIAIFYTLDGGFSGHQYFNYDTDDVIVSQSGKIIVITKPIEMQ